MFLITSIRLLLSFNSTSSFPTFLPFSLKVVIFLGLVLKIGIGIPLIPIEPVVPELVWPLLTLIITIIISCFYYIIGISVLVL